MTSVPRPPRGWAMLLLIGPSLVWAAEYIGSGEVILATRTGAVLGTSVVWAVVLGIVLKYWIGLCGARYTVCTGEAMVDLFARMPGPRNWAVWIVLIGQFAAATVAIGSLAAAAGAFVQALLPIGSMLGGWLVTLVAVAIVWSGTFDVLKGVMSVLVAFIVLGVGYLAVQVFPGWAVVLGGLVPQVPDVPAWAVTEGESPNAWREILPLLGWGAGGFASQVWYTYWVQGAGYGLAAEATPGQPADADRLRRLTTADAEQVRGWLRVVSIDASVAMGLGVIVTLCFLLAGAGVLRPQEVAPEGADVALTLATLFSARWGEVGGLLFLIGGTAALLATQIGQLAGWPRLLADAVRLCLPRLVERVGWKTQFRFWLIFFVFTNMGIVYSFGVRPVALVQLGAVLDGLLLTPLQALWVGLGLYVVLPRLYSKEAYAVIRPHWGVGVGLLVALLAFSYFCIAQLPAVLR